MHFDPATDPSKTPCFAGLFRGSFVKVESILNPILNSILNDILIIKLLFEVNFKLLCSMKCKLKFTLVRRGCWKDLILPFLLALCLLQPHSPVATAMAAFESFVSLSIPMHSSLGAGRNSSTADGTLAKATLTAAVDVANCISIYTPFASFLLCVHMNQVRSTAW